MQEYQGQMMRNSAAGHYNQKPDDPNDANLTNLLNVQGANAGSPAHQKGKPSFGSHVARFKYRDSQLETLKGAPGPGWYAK